MNIKYLNFDMTPEIPENPYITFNNAIIVTFIILVFYVSFILLINNSYLSMAFNDIITPIIEISVAICLFYAAKISGTTNKRLQIAWTILGVSVLIYAAADIIYAIMELYIQQVPNPSVADIFYLLFYPLFALGIYYLPKVSIPKNEELKLIIDTAILVTTIGIILWIFLIVPTIQENSNLLGVTVSITYVLGDVVLLFALIRILFRNFENTYLGPLILIGLAIIAQIITDSIYYHQLLQGIYASGGLLDTGWIISMLFIGLAAILQTNNIIYGQKKNIKFESWLQNINFPTHLPILSVIIAFIILVWSSFNSDPLNLIFIEFGVGITIFLVLIRQIITLNENKSLYKETIKEIENRKIVEKDLFESRNYFQSVFNNSPIGIYHSSPDGKLLESNQTLSSVLGYKSIEEFENIVNKSNISDIVWVDKDQRQKIVNQVLNDNLWHKTECELYKKDGEILIADLSMRSYKNPDGSLKYLEGFILDITKRKKDEEALKLSEAYYRTIFENTGTLTLIEEEDTTVSLINSEVVELSGYSKEEIESKMSWTEFIANKDDLKKMLEYHRLRRVNPDSAPRNYETKIIDRNGVLKDVLITASIIPGTKKSLLSILDISDRKKAEEALKTSLEEKEILLKEVHHRVKNNMQIISSLINLQLSTIKDKKALETLKMSQGRIQSMALIHENLYRSDTLASINMKEYIERLVTDLKNSYNAQYIDLKFNLENITLDIDNSIPCGLIINELVTNSIKHAFPEGVGTLKIEFIQKENKYKLTVSDNGKGLPKSFDLQNCKSLGLRLVNILTDQINGELDIINENGTTFIITF